MPVVSAVRGPAAGIGCSLALAADFCVASETAYFLQAFVNIGLVPDGGASWMLPRLIGRARATEMMMLGERVPAAKALDWGMVYQVVVGRCSSTREALKLAERLASGADARLWRDPAAAARRRTRATMRPRWHSRRTTSARCAAPPTPTEGGRAFLEKRKPMFEGRVMAEIETQHWARTAERRRLRATCPSRRRTRASPHGRQRPRRR